MGNGTKRFWVSSRAWIAIWIPVAVVAVAAVAWFALAPAERASDPAPAVAEDDRVAAAPARPEAPIPPAAEARDLPPAEPAPDPQPLELPPGFSADVMRMPWGIVDLDEVRDAMPDNLYWQMAAPTDDLRVQKEREDERSRWNVEYGKVLSGTGTEEEIQAYFSHRQRLSADYVQFVSHLLEHYGGQLPEQDVGLLELTRKLHLARLEEIPRKTQEAIERKLAQDAAREAWLREEAEFEASDAD